jgi:HlyD family secretion protein
MKKKLPVDSRARSAPLLTALVLALLVSGCGRSATNGELVLSGNIEITDAQLAFKIPGRVAERRVAEGERVTAGQLVARLEDPEQTAELALRRAELAAANAALAELEAGSRPQEIAAVAAALRSMQAEHARAKLEFTRQQELLAKAAISSREFESAQAALDVADARVGEAGERLRLVEAGPRAETILQARARTEQAVAAVALAQARLDQTRLISPLTGIVLSHGVEPGEFVSAGTPVATVADTSNLWVRVYINSTDLGRIRRGQKVTVRTDSRESATHEGTISFIAADAEFTPKTVQTPKERVKLVFRLKVVVANPDDVLKPGMPADVVIP